MEKNPNIKRIVKDAYGKIAREGSSCCGPFGSCCGGSSLIDTSKSMGYSEEDLRIVPQQANLGLGCGNPIAVASLKEGEIVLDLGCGAGFDCFLAASKVGNKGKVVGVDMTREMIQRANENARFGGYENVEFIVAEIENLPVRDNYVDVVISNCVINLSTDKKKVFSEAFRVLKEGGRILISDIVLRKSLPDLIKNSVEAYVSCISGAMRKEEYLEIIEQTGFQKLTIIDERTFPIGCLWNDSMAGILSKAAQKQLEELVDTIVSINILAFKL